MAEASAGAADTQRIRQLVTGYQVARALLAADELGLVQRLDDAPKDAEELARETGTHAGALHRFLRALSTIDLLVEQDDGRFAPGPIAADLHDAARVGVENYRAWAELPYSLRTGEPAFPQVFGKTFYEYLSEDESRAARFDSALAAVSRDWAPAVFEAYDFSQFATVADIGGGRGTFLAMLLEAHPAQQGILFDLAQVIQHAGPILTSAGVTERCQCVGGTFFESVPAGADAYTLCNLLADWNDEQAVAILRSCVAAMPAHGRVLVIDRVLPPRGDSNRGPMAFLDLFFLVMEGGAIRDAGEFEMLFSTAGLQLSDTIGTRSTFSVLEGRLPASVEME